MSEKIEGRDYVVCQICDKHFKRLTNSHLKTHGIGFDEYTTMFPDAILTSDDTKISVGISNIGKRCLEITHDDLMIRDGIEGFDYVLCPICETPLKTISYTHLKKHNMTIEEFKDKYPNVDMICKDHRDTLSTASINRVYDDGMTIDEWLDYHTGKHLCKCGCGSIIKIYKYHHESEVGIPEYIPGHSSMLKDGHVTKDRSNKLSESMLKVWDGNDSRKDELSIRMIDDNPMYNSEHVQKLINTIGDSRSTIEYKEMQRDVQKLTWANSELLEKHSILMSNIMGKYHRIKRWIKISQEFADGKSIRDWVSKYVHTVPIEQYEFWRSTIIKRDNNTCQKCGTKIGVKHAHHILPRRDYPEFILTVDNGITLCENCHRETYGKEYDFMPEFLGKIFDDKAKQLFI